MRENMVHMQRHPPPPDAGQEAMTTDPVISPELGPSCGPTNGPSVTPLSSPVKMPSKTVSEESPAIIEADADSGVQDLIRLCQAEQWEMAVAMQERMVALAEKLVESEPEIATAIYSNLGFAHERLAESSLDFEDRRRFWNGALAMQQSATALAKRYVCSCEKSLDDLVDRCQIIQLCVPFRCACAVTSLSCVPYFS